MFGHWFRFMGGVFEFTQSWSVATARMMGMQTPKIFTLPVTTDRRYFDAVQECREGDRVTFLYSDRGSVDVHSISVCSSRQKLIGHLYDDKYFFQALIDDRRPYMARIGLIDLSPDLRTYSLALYLSLDVGEPIRDGVTILHDV